jgi:hypothetical protein
LKIVSANYHDRNSDHRWLIRDADQDPEQAVAVKSVIATDVAFCQSTSYEAGFGCSIVAQCQTAEEAENPEQIGERLRFDFDAFYTKDRVRVPTCHQLLLKEDGSMWAIIKAERPRRSRKKELVNA